MRILALQAYDTGSHRAFLNGWRRHSEHDFEVLTLPGHHFKWRMRQAPIGFVEQLEPLIANGQDYDALWCTSMLDLAALRGLSTFIHDLPAAVYFHENQLAYPARHSEARDIHFGLTNMTTALAAIASQRNASVPCIWWNSTYNRDSFLIELDRVLKAMPDHVPDHVTEQIRLRSAIHYPGIDRVDNKTRERSDPPVLLWAARWEHDKHPERFFDALQELDKRGGAFRISVIGQQFSEQPECFEIAEKRFADKIVRWGYQSDKSDYQKALAEADFVISTAGHEFFGLAIAEAVSAGCQPVLPNALAYPEVWGEHAVYHDQTPSGIADAIELAILQRTGTNSAEAAERFAWPGVARKLDDAIESLRF